MTDQPTNRYDALSERARWYMSNFDELDLAEMCAASEPATEQLHARAEKAEAGRDRYRDAWRAARRCVGGWRTRTEQAEAANTRVRALAVDVDDPSWRAPGTEVAARIRLALTGEEPPPDDQSTPETPDEPRPMMQSKYPIRVGAATVAADMCPKCKGDNTEAWGLCTQCAPATPVCALPGFMSCECDHITGCQNPAPDDSQTTADNPVTSDCGTCKRPSGRHSAGCREGRRQRQRRQFKGTPIQGSGYSPAQLLGADTDPADDAARADG